MTKNLDSVNKTLMFAASNGYNDIIEFMLEKGADVNFKGSENYTPLMNAVKSHNLETVKFLLEKGSNVNLKSKDNKTALLLTWEEDIIKLLLEHGANINAKDNDNDTFLFKAVYNGHDKFTNLAIKYGANPNVLYSDGESILYYAAKLHDTKILESLLSIKGINPNIRNKNGETALSLVVRKQKLEHIRLLLKAGANPNTTTEEKIPVLIDIILNASYNVFDYEVVKLLIDAGADINIRNKGNCYNIEIDDTPLIAAVRWNRKKIVELLLKNKANVNLKNKLGNTALWYAVDNGNIKITELLVKAGANLNLTNKNGWTVLMNAVSKNRLEIVELLLKNKANVKVKNPIRKDTALNYVNNHPTGIDDKIEEILKQYGKSKKKGE